MNFIMSEISQTTIACIPAKYHENSMMVKSVKIEIFMYP